MIASPATTRRRLDRWALAVAILSLPVTFGFWPAGPVLALAALVLAFADRRRRGGGMSGAASWATVLAVIELGLFALLVYVVSSSLP